MESQFQTENGELSFKKMEETLENIRKHQKTLEKYKKLILKNIETLKKPKTKKYRDLISALFTTVGEGGGGGSVFKTDKQCFIQLDPYISGYIQVYPGISR